MSDERSGRTASEPRRWVRSARAAAVDVGEALVLVDRDAGALSAVRRLDGESAELAREVLAVLAQPRTEAEVIDHVERLAGPLGERRAIVHELLELLAATGATTRPPNERAIGINVVVAISGAIAASHAPALVNALQRRGHTVEVALTPTAARFVAADALAAIVQRELHVSMWPRVAHAPVPHVALARWAELVIVYPATATTIARIAHGDFSELVAAIALTTLAPVVIVPSMNHEMLEAPAVQRNLEQLRADGHAIVHGVPSQEIAESPAVRATIGGAAPSPVEVVATIEALRTAGVLRAAEHAWNAAYRGPRVPWATDTCDPDLAEALAEHAPSRCRVLDIGCGLGQVARHAAAAGHRVVATDVSDVALSAARASAPDADIIWLRDDICATALAGPFEVIVDRASLHTLPRARATAWAAAIRRLATSMVIVKCHRDGVAGVTTGWSATALAALFPDFDVVSERAAELPGLADPAPIPSLLIVLRRR